MVISCTGVAFSFHVNDGSFSRLDPVRMKKNVIDRPVNLNLNGIYWLTTDGWMILSWKYSSSLSKIPRRRRLPEQAVVEDNEVHVEAKVNVVVVQVDSVVVTINVTV